MEKTTSVIIILYNKFFSILQYIIMYYNIIQYFTIIILPFVLENYTISVFDLFFVEDS